MHPLYSLFGKRRCDWNRLPLRYGLVIRRFKPLSQSSLAFYLLGQLRSAFRLNERHNTWAYALLFTFHYLVSMDKLFLCRQLLYCSWADITSSNAPTAAPLSTFFVTLLPMMPPIIAPANASRFCHRLRKHHDILLHYRIWE